MIRASLIVLGLAACLAAEGPAVQESAVRSHLAFLADDLLEGRGSGSRGGRLAVRYLESQLQALGFRPAWGESYLQPVKLVGMRTLQAQTHLAFSGPEGRFPFRIGQDFLVGAGAPSDQLQVDAPFLFVGHGVTQGGRDDFKGVDVRGKILLAVVGDRPDQESGCCTPSHYAGRWAYKIREARRRGAAGILLIHEADRAGYDWTVVRATWSLERVHREPVSEGAGVQGWIAQSAARSLFRAAGLDFEALRAAADRPDFKPVPLPETRLKGTLRSEVRRFEDMNVAAVLPGTDPILTREAVVYSAHWDHLGLDQTSGRIYNGAVDNASGCAGVLAIAQALVGRPTRRSQMFLFTCAEEPGLLGAEAFVTDPPWPLDKLVAVLNLESLNFAGPTRDIGLAGSESSTLRERAEQVAKDMGLAVTPSRPDPSGLFFRSDHFPFVKAGVPAFSPGFSLDGGWDFPDPRMASRAKEYLARHYHQVSDRYDPAWDLRGMLQQIQFTLALGLELSERPDRPVWKAGPLAW